MTQNTDDMNETMDAIEVQDQPEKSNNRRDQLVGDISVLKSGIKGAQDATDKMNDEQYSPISPEQANELKRNIVFLKKDLEKKTTELDSLDS